MKLLSIFIFIIGYMLSNINNPIKEIPQWNIPQNTQVSWNIPNIDTVKKYNSKQPPKEVVSYVYKIAAKYQIQPAAILAACYHERGIKNWYDPFLCGFGATDNLNWNMSKWGGWQKQIRLFAKRANNCGYFKIGTHITKHHAQNFARHCYKTTAWQNYGRIVNYIKAFEI